MRAMTCGTVLLNPYIGHANINQFRQKEVGNHIVTSGTSNSPYLTSLVFKKNMVQLCFQPKISTKQ